MTKIDEFEEDLKALCEQYWERYEFDLTTSTGFLDPKLTHVITIQFKHGKL